jgi:epoxyqueuosine reductase
LKRKHEQSSPPGHKPEGWGFLGNLSDTLGFSAIGVIPAGPLSLDATVRYHQWLKNGYHADMSYLAKHNAVIRQDSANKNLLKEATAVVVVAMPYGHGAVQNGVWRYVARHARGRDYHKTLKQKLKALAAGIKHHFPDIAYRVFVDSAPLMERSLALMAGLGTIGKNGALIVKNIGPCVLLGEIICSGVPMPSPPPSPPPPFEVCQSCNLCIMNCPTHAIVAPGVVDAGSCLSYWTIEAKAQYLSEQISHKINSIFGCDICTAICPFNQTTQGGVEAPTSDVPVPETLKSLIETETHRLEAAFSGTAIRRTGVRQIKRNAAYLLAKERTDP